MVGFSVWPCLVNSREQIQYMFVPINTMIVIYIENRQ